MNFAVFNDLINQINKDLNTDGFCRNFQYKRKDLTGASRANTLNQLFVARDDDWSINEGGGTEAQYHISINHKDHIISYGLGFSAQYVQFKNDMSPVEYIRPFMQAFLQRELEIQKILHDYSFIIGSKENLLNPQNAQFNLFGKTVQLEEDDADNYVMDDTDYQNLLNDLKSRQFEVYIKIFEQKEAIQNYRKNLMAKIKTFQDVLIFKNQIILQGSPGTGKTYTAKDIAYSLIFNQSILEKDRNEALKELSGSTQFKLIQFHPAYSYEDFVRGITGKANGQSIEYITENKILAEFAQLAHQNYLDSQKAPEQLAIEQQFNDFVEAVKTHICTSEEKFLLTTGTHICEVTPKGFKYDGKDWTTKPTMPFTDILKMYEAGITEAKQIRSMIDISSTAKTDSTYSLAILNAFRKFLKEHPIVANASKVPSAPLKNYVLIIDEINRANLPSVLGELIYALEYRGEPVNSMYDALNGKYQLILPKNLFIIGTMNTADRSVGHIDYAIRRRFAFMDILPKLSVVKELGNPRATKLFESVASLFCEKYEEQAEGKTTHLTKSSDLAPDFKPEDVMLGHSYFLAKDNHTLEFKLEYEIKPILREYLKDGILLETAKNKIEALHA